MIKKVLKINGTVVLTKKQRANINGGNMSLECPSTQPGLPGAPCTSDAECFNIVFNTQGTCNFGCCDAVT